MAGLWGRKAENPYRATTGRITHRALSRLVPDGWFVTTKDPFSTAESEPEPEVMIVQSHIDDYGERHP